MKYLLGSEMGSDYEEDDVEEFHSMSDVAAGIFSFI